MSEEKKRFLFALLVPGSFVILLWLIIIIENLFYLDFVKYGLYPHKISGLIGLVFSPLIHGSYDHLISNSIPIIFLGTGILYFYPNSSLKVFLIIYFLPGIVVWFIGRPSYHIGASGMIYGYVTFLFFSGLIRRDNRSIALSLIVTFLYGSLIWGVLPIREGVSWEFHLAGALAGILCAFLFRKSDPYKKYDWEDEEEEVNVDELEIRYDKDYPFKGS